MTIEPEALEDKEMLEDLLVAAVNEAIKEAQNCPLRKWPK